LPTRFGEASDHGPGATTSQEVEPNIRRTLDAVRAKGRNESGPSLDSVKAVERCYEPPAFRGVDVCRAPPRV